MKTNNLFFTFLLIIIFISAASYAKKGDNEWILHKEVNGIQIYYKYVECNIPSEGYYQEQVLLKFVNTTQTPLKIKWQREAWFQGKCTSCGKDEYKFELNIPAGESIVGDCDIYSPSKLKIFSKFLDLKSEVKLEKFNIDVLEVAPY